MDKAKGGNFLSMVKRKMTKIKNLIINGNFLDGTNNWFAQSAIQSVVTFDGQDNALSVADNGPWSASKQAINTEANEYYKITGKRHALGINDNSNMFVYDGDAELVYKEVVGDIFGAQSQTSTSVWENLYSGFYARGLKTTITVGSGGTNTGYFSDISIIKSGDAIYAHRGFKTYRPENTIVAFQNAIDLGSRLLEMDVQITSDGVPVVIHDSTVDRTTNGTGNVSSFTLAEIQALDAGTWFDPLYAGEKIPTFAEVIALAKANGCSIAPETKGYRTQADIQLMVNEVADFTNEVIWQSFTFSDMDVLRTYDANANVGFLHSTDVQTALTSAIAIGGNTSIWVQGTAWTMDLARQTRDAGVTSFAWTITTSTIADELLGFGIDYIVTDFDLYPTLIDRKWLVPNGDFNTDLVDWDDVNNYWSWVNGRAYHTNTTVFNSFMTILVENTNYRLTFDYEVISGYLSFSQRTAGNVFVEALGDRINGSGTYTIDFTSTIGAERLSFYRDGVGASSSEFYIDNVYLEII